MRHSDPHWLGSASSRTGSGAGTGVSSGPEGTTLLLSVPLKEARAHESDLVRDINREHDPSGWGEL